MTKAAQKLQTLICLFLSALDAVVPKRQHIIFVTFPDGDDQCAALCSALQQERWPGTVDWLVNGNPDTFVGWAEKRGFADVRVRFRRKFSIGGFWCYLRARWVFYTHGAYLSYKPPASKIVVNLWHGMPIKRIWGGMAKSSIAPQSTLLASTSPFFTQVLMQSSGFRWDQMCESGLPRNDFLSSPRPAVVERVRKLKGEVHRLILFLPTYRKSNIGFITEDGSETGRLLGLSEVEASDLHRWLQRNDCKLLVKAHPMSVMTGSQFPDDKHWAMVDEMRLCAMGMGLYELLSQADLLITDLSSICIDFLKTKRPQIFYFPDMEKYKRSRGVLLEPLEDYIPGPIATDYPQLEGFLEIWASGADPWRDKRQQLRKLMIPDQSQSAGLRILEVAGVLPTALIPHRMPYRHVAVFVWAQFGPYHFARLRAMTKSAGSLQVLGLEIGSKTNTYAWERNERAPNLSTLFPGASAETVSSARIFLAAVQYFTERGVTVVYVPSYWPASSLALLLAARSVGARAVMMNDTHEKTAKARGLWLKVKRYIIRTFDAALVGGTPQKNYFSSLGMCSDKIILGYDAIDNVFFERGAQSARGQAAEVRRKRGLPEKYFLNVGRMVWKKNLETLVDAYTLTKSRLGVTCPALVLVGNGPLESALQARCREKGLIVALDEIGQPSVADVWFFSFKQASDLPDFYALADCFILPSRKEEWGLVVNEAMACGLPVLVSRVAGCAQDLVRDGENGFLFDPFDVSALAGQLEMIARKPEMIATMGSVSRCIIAEWGCDHFARTAQEALVIAMGGSRRSASRGGSKSFGETSTLNSESSINETMSRMRSILLLRHLAALVILLGLDVHSKLHRFFKRKVDENSDD